jgi:hypothetical protein
MCAFDRRVEPIKRAEPFGLTFLPWLCPALNMGLHESAIAPVNGHPPAWIIREDVKGGVH